MISGNEPLTLYELNALVRGAINERLSSCYWVVGELSEVRETAAGHCYIELVQRDEATREMTAKARGTIWSRIYSLLRPYFLEQTGQPFGVGLKVLLQVTVDFHELYGYALDVRDIEPAYTIGDIARQRQLIINRLQQEGVINLNKELEFPALPQRVAVISSATAAGYDDFCHQLQNNPYGFHFYTRLFSSPMQGARTEQGIIEALNRIAENMDFWDIVVIIRGGGATSDLSCFDTYDLANNCAQFPLPIITGIGHHRDDTLLDIVAHTRAKTPTAAAELLIHSMAAQAARLDNMANGLVALSRELLSDSHRRLQAMVQRLPAATALLLQQNKHRLDILQQQATAASPQRILALGYTLTTCNGRIVRSASDVEPGCVLTTRTIDGEITSVINEIKR